jgi:hypothetical protein
VIACLPPDITNRGASFQNRHKSKGGMRKLRSIVAGSNLDLINRATPLSQLASRSLPDQSSAFIAPKSLVRF